MEDKYIGVKPGGKGRFESTNLGIIFSKKLDGNYYGTSFLDGRVIKCTPEQIKHDLQLNYLSPYIES